MSATALTTRRVSTDSDLLDIAGDAHLDAIARSTNLEELTGIVRSGRRTFVEVGWALWRIRDAKLYKLTHSSWESWLQDNWWGSRRHADRQIAAARMTGGDSDPGVPTERVARELARLPDNAARVEAMAEAMDEADGKPTAQDVRRAVDRKLEVVAETKVRKSTQNRRTPQWLFDVLNEMFGPFKLDAYADEDNALCDEFYTVEEDGNAQPWKDATFANPEFRDMYPVLEQALRQAALGVRSIILGPVGCSQEWFHELAIQGTVFVPDCRINYDDPEGNPTGHGLDEGGADRDTMVFAFGPGCENPRAGEGVFLAKRLLIKGRRP